MYWQSWKVVPSYFGTTLRLILQPCGHVNPFYPSPRCLSPNPIDPPCYASFPAHINDKRAASHHAPTPFFLQTVPAYTHSGLKRWLPGVQNAKEIPEKGRNMLRQDLYNTIRKIFTFTPLFWTELQSKWTKTYVSFLATQEVTSSSLRNTSTCMSIWKRFFSL